MDVHVNNKDKSGQCILIWVHVFSKCISWAFTYVVDWAE